MTISKDFRFPVTVHWQGEQLARAVSPGLDDIDIAVPPEFRGPGGSWSPEQLLVAAAGSCFAVTFAAIAERRRIPIHFLTVTGTGHVAHRDGPIGFVALELTPRIETEPEFVGRTEHAARSAHAACLVTEALDVPVHIVPLVTAVEPAVA